jgi:CheY-like chemotaxis protein
VIIALTSRYSEALKPVGRQLVEAEQQAVLLVVEDDRDMRSLLCDELWDLGLRIVEAEDGHAALEQLEECRPRLILSDLRMPAGGLDYVARLRMLAPQVPIVLMTAFGDPETKAQAYDYGVSAFVEKPVRMAELKMTIKNLLNRKPA